MKSIDIINQIQKDLVLKEKYELIIKALLIDLNLNKSALIGIQLCKFIDDITPETAFLILDSQILED